MIGVDADYYDGRSAARRIVRVEVLDNGEVSIHGDGVSRRLDSSELRISPRLGNTPRYLYLPDGARCEFADNDALDEVAARLGGRAANRLVHFLESRYATAVAALLLTVAAVFAAIEYGIPVLSRQVALSLPQEVEASLGREGLDALDRGVFGPSALGSAAQKRIRLLFDALAEDAQTDVNVRLELRSGKRLGANAFALPSGLIVITDEMIALTASDEELMAVMAHEIGHVKHRHILRQILQNSLTALLVAGLFGDLSSIAGLSATLPTFLVQQKYSRRFEREADAYAADVLGSRGLAVQHLVNVLERLAQEDGGPEPDLLTYLSSHPATRERIEALRQY
ncbi:MAG: M48 family metallopeptidase [Gammaproteobacteria bacterium]|nr:M48 family metallopeptidase [Gammaproteobacteria bacterium]